MNAVHPLIKKELNAEQLQAVSQKKNCVVAAGAGSGKTRVLAYRFAHLVVDCNMSVDSILTLTFTKKATAEMYGRIYKTLKNIADSPESDDLAKTRAQRAIDNFHTARIQTLDSFCANIVRSGSRFYGIRPDFSTDDATLEDFFRITARDFMLKHRNNPALQTLCASSKFEDAANDIFAKPIKKYSNIAYPIDFSAYLQKQIEKILLEWQTQIDIIFSHKDILQSADIKHATIFSGLEEIYPDAAVISRYFLLNQNNTGDENQNNAENQKLYATVKTFFDSLYTLKKISKIRKKIPEKDAINTAIEEIRQSYDILSSLAHYVYNFPALLQILVLLRDFQHIVTEKKRSTGMLSFSDVSSLALRILIEQSDIRKAEKNRTDAIMIDEFQDNNEMQRNMLFLLAEKNNRTAASIPSIEELCPEKLFFVGDEKQSIYRFRGADVSVFTKLKNDLNAENLSLSINYRSDAQLLAAFNALFGGYDYIGKVGAYEGQERLCNTENTSSIFIQENQLIENTTLPIFEAAYNPLYAPTPCDENPDFSGKEVCDEEKIFLCLLDTSHDTEKNDEKEETLEKSENQAVFVAEKIKSLCQSNYKPQDIAILFRSYAKQAMYEKHLRRLGIPYISESILSFFSDAPTNDIFNLIRLIVYPQDMMSFSTVLRSPFVRLSQEETTACLLSARNDSDLQEDILFCEKHAEFLDTEAKSRYANGLERYNRLKEISTTIECAEMISYIWYNEGYRYETLWNADVSSFSQLYDYLFEIARTIDSAGGNLSHLADYLTESAKKNERLNDMDIPIEQKGAVRLMSIHKSKGLEFPVVFLCETASKGRANSMESKVYIDDEWGISINFPQPPFVQDCQKNYFFNIMATIENQKKAAELRRLLYVALTRAEKELYIIGSFSANKDVKKSLTEYDDGFGENENIFAILEAVFEDKLKKSAEKDSAITKAEYNLHNDTLFSFLLPLIVQFKDKKTPFKIESIPFRTQKDLQKIAVSAEKTSMQNVYNRVKNIFENATEIKTPIIESPYKNPSKLGKAMHAGSFLYRNDETHKNHMVTEADTITENSKGKFTYADFGTIAHIFAQAAFTGKNPMIPTHITHALSDANMKTICTVAQSMVDEFMQSTLAQEAKQALWLKTEYDFKLSIKNPALSDNKQIIVTGQIDLIYEKKDGTLVIVDYKTDSIKKPEEHVLQLSAYRHAASHMFDKDFKNIECFIYYFRSADAINISEQTLLQKEQLIN